MSLTVFRPFILGIILIISGLNAIAGLASFTDRGNADFDRALQLLNPYGTWAKIDGAWAYTPLDHMVPYTNGRWIYTEFGWCWKGNAPHSWVTEHYGYWKRSTDKVWSWYPGPYWLAQIVEFRATPTHIGWRCAAVDQEGNFIEAPDDRYAKTDEWTFVTKAQFANPITPGIAVKPEEAQKLLLDSTDCAHTYLTYRPIDRPGPHPADFIALCKDGGMFSPLQSEIIEQTPPPSTLALPPIVSNNNTPATNAPTPGAPPPKSKLATIPVLRPINSNPLNPEDVDPSLDRRQVKYWITMSLPTFWTPRPPGAKMEEVYLYRPDFYQDQDGIARRITLWFNPKSRLSLKEVLAESSGQKSQAPASNGSPVAATPAVSAAPEASSHDPFHSNQLDGPYSGSRSASSSSKTNATSTVAPSGLMSDSAAGK